MKNRTRLLIQVILIILIQVSFINNGILFKLYPNLLLVFTAYIAQKDGKISGALVGLLLGLLVDVLLSPNFGIKGLALLLVGYTIGSLSEFIFEESYRSAILYVLVGVIVYSVVSGIVYFFLSYNVSIGRILGQIIKIETIANVLLFILIQELNLDKESNFKFIKLKKD